MSDHSALGTASWTEASGGRLRPDERRALLAPLARGLLVTTVGLTRLAVRKHPGRSAVIDESLLAPPDSALTRDAATAAADTLSPALRNHSHRAYAWGAAIAALEGLSFDRELLYVAAMFHDTGLPTPVPGVDFTVASAATAREFADSHAVAAARRERIADAICLHHTPGVTPDRGAEAYLLSAGAAVDVFGLRSWELPDDVRSRVVADFPRAGFKREFSRLWRTEAKRVPGGRGQLLHRYALSDVTIRTAPFKG